VERPVLDLMTGMASDQSLSINWRRWRWPLVLAGLLLATNVVALNWDWWRLKSEGEALHAGMIRVYKTTFPNDVVIVDPLVQMQKKITALRKRSGEITPSDFLSLAATLGEIEKTLPDKSGDESTKFSIAALEYRDAILVVRFKLGTNPPTEAVRTALAARHITLTDAPPENGATVWRLRSAL
jgi:general secretion pathway protein L